MNHSIWPLGSLSVEIVSPVTEVNHKMSQPRFQLDRRQLLQIGAAGVVGSALPISEGQLVAATAPARAKSQ